MKLYTFSNPTATWWAEYWTDGMANSDNLRIMSIRSMSVGGAMNNTDIDSAMVALGLPDKVGTPVTEVELKTLALMLNLDLNMIVDEAASVRKYASLAVQATPTFSPVAGAVPFGQVITITSADAAAIYYTKNGAVPNTTLGTNQATTACTITAEGTIKAIAYSGTLYQSLIGSAAYTQAVVAAPTNVVLAVGSTEPVGGVTNVAIPAAGATDSTGAIIGWADATADKIKITVTNAASTSSTITINGAAYVSGADFDIAVGVVSLTVVVTSTRANYKTQVRTFVIPVAAV